MPVLPCSSAVYANRAHHHADRPAGRRDRAPARGPVGPEGKNHRLVEDQKRKTSLIEGEAVRSCQTPLSRVGGRAVTTQEGLGSPANPHKGQAAFIAEQAAQCGYCSNGMIMTTAALLAREAKPDAARIKDALAGNLCRCGTHDRVVKAVLRAAGRA